MGREARASRATFWRLAFFVGLETLEANPEHQAGGAVVTVCLAESSPPTAHRTELLRTGEEDRRLQALSAKLGITLGAATERCMNVGYREVERLREEDGARLAGFAATADAALSKARQS